MAAVRLIRGLRPHHSSIHLSKLGGKRHQRQLFEVVLAPSSPLIGTSQDQLWRTQNFVACAESALVAARRPGEDLEIDTPLIPSDVLLVEAHSSFSKSAVVQHFSVLASTPQSTPPRNQESDRRRGYVIAALQFLVFALAGYRVAELHILAGLLVLFCVIVRAISVDDAWASMSGPMFVATASAGGSARLLKAVDWHMSSRR